jgi:hypothetical protein
MENEPISWFIMNQKWNKKIHMLLELPYFGTIDILDMFFTYRIAVPLTSFQVSCLNMYKKI